MKSTIVALSLLLGFLIGHNYEWAKYQIFDCTCDPSNVIIMTGNLGLENIATFEKVVCKGHPEYPPTIPKWLWRWMSNKVDHGV